MVFLLLLHLFIVCSNGAQRVGPDVCWKTACNTNMLPLVTEMLTLEVCCKQRGGTAWGLTTGECLDCPVSTTVPPTTESVATEEPIVVAGNLGAWTEWGDCSATCGANAYQGRRRSCEPLGARCVGDLLEGRACLPKPFPCPVPGSWGEWAVWSKCDGTCRQQRSRQCDSPPPKYGGLECSGSATDERSCDRNPPCKVDGEWSEWSVLFPCTKTCGTGIEIRSRACNNPEPKHGGESCSGPSNNVGVCNSHPCPVHGEWGDWTTWTGCEVSCGTGRRFRKRKCDSPSPEGGGRDCRGFAEAVEPCAPNPCPLDGGWSSWTRSTSCSRSCGGGTQQMFRQCNDPSPNYGGRFCAGFPREVLPCNDNCCPVNGKWSNWGSWSVCSATCGSGVRKRNRTCDDPPKKCDGLDCPGSHFSRDPCNVLPCPVDGVWSEWSNWTPCSKSCEGGVRFRNRKCDSPRPDHGGRSCPGQHSSYSQCNTHKCPVDGGWGPWTLWSHCTSKCDIGSQTRTRACNSPRPAFNGSECDGGEPTDWKPCHNNCPVHGGWSDWSTWTQCTQSCEGGTKNRYRVCNSPPPRHDGRPCPGHSYQASECNKQPCPVDGGWGQWSIWGFCSVSCGGGIYNRTRKCDDPAPRFGGIDCEGASTDKDECNNHPCPIDGAWGSWSFWSPCSASCGPHNHGKRFRTRQCNDPSPDFGGKFCLDRSTAKEEEACNRKRCPIHGGWSPWESWTYCTKTCRREGETPGTQHRNRSCNNPVPQFEGADCGGNNRAERHCFDSPCPVDGEWGQWGSFGKCTKTCGIGLKERQRHCIPPQNGGQYCSGFSSNKQQCCETPCTQLQVKSRQIEVRTVRHRTVSGWRWCGFAGWSRCHTSTIHYFLVTKKATQYYHVRATSEPCS